MFNDGQALYSYVVNNPDVDWSVELLENITSLFVVGQESLDDQFYLILDSMPIDIKEGYVDDILDIRNFNPYDLQQLKGRYQTFQQEQPVIRQEDFDDWTEYANAVFESRGSKEGKFGDEIGYRIEVIKSPYTLEDVGMGGSTDMYPPMKEHGAHLAILIILTDDAVDYLEDNYGLDPYSDLFTLHFGDVDKHVFGWARLSQPKPGQWVVIELETDLYIKIVAKAPALKDTLKGWKDVVVKECKNVAQLSGADNMWMLEGKAQVLDQQLGFSSILTSNFKNKLLHNIVSGDKETKEKIKQEMISAGFATEANELFGEDKKDSGPSMMDMMVEDMRSRGTDEESISKLHSIKDNKKKIRFLKSLGYTDADIKNFFSSAKSKGEGRKRLTDEERTEKAKEYVEKYWMYHDPITKNITNNYTPFELEEDVVTTREGTAYGAEQWVALNVDQEALFSKGKARSGRYADILEEALEIYLQKKGFDRFKESDEETIRNELIRRKYRKEKLEGKDKEELLSILANDIKMYALGRPEIELWQSGIIRMPEGYKEAVSQRVPTQEAADNASSIDWIKDNVEEYMKFRDYYISKEIRQKVMHGSHEFDYMSEYMYEHGGAKQYDEFGRPLFGDPVESPLATGLEHYKSMYKVFRLINKLEKIANALDNCGMVKCASEVDDIICVTGLVKVF